MAGNIMRTPIIQKEIMSIWNEQIPISKGILIDECTIIQNELCQLGMNIFQKVF